MTLAGSYMVHPVKAREVLRYDVAPQGNARYAPRVILIQSFQRKTEIITLDS